MSVRRRALIAMVSLASAAALAVAAPAGAAPGNGNGAQILRGTTCSEDADFIYCDTIRSEQNFHSSGTSGNTHWPANSVDVFTVTSKATGAVVYSSNIQAHDGFLYKDGAYQVVFESRNGTFLDDGSVTGTPGTYCYSVSYHYANGEVKVDRTEIVPADQCPVQYSRPLP